MIRGICYLLLILLLLSCKAKHSSENTLPDPSNATAVILDTDANNELDDQHAMAYMFFNQDFFDIKGVTVNATYSGGEIGNHLDEADRIMHLCGVKGKIPLLKGANGSFDSIVDHINQDYYDGQEAVDFIVEMARSTEDLVLLPIGKLTNIALALAKAPDIKDKIRIVWLGSNYPEPGEYNLENDIQAMNYVLNQDVDFEMVTVRYGDPSGSYYVQVTPMDISEHLKGKGPRMEPIEGRHGSMFSNFGDYSVDLFDKADLYGSPPARSLYDLVAAAILKNPGWGNKVSIPCPIMENGKWIERPDNPNQIIIWDNFDKEGILEDFYQSFDK